MTSNRGEHQPEADEHERQQLSPAAGDRCSHGTQQHEQRREAVPDDPAALCHRLISLRQNRFPVSGLVDIHAHVIPGIDDGPRNLEQALEMVRRVRDNGVTIVLIEHVMKVIVGVCRRALVLNFGRTLVEGPPAEVLKDRRVIEAYLGQRYARDQQPPPNPPPQAGEGNEK